MRRPDPSTWSQLEGMLDRAFELEGSARSRFLDKACGSDAELRARAERLIAADEAAEGFLEEPDRLLARLSELPSPEESETPDRLPDSIGPYRVLSEIAQGGMGAVYLAERDDGQFEQRVAVKLVRTGGDARTLRSRFLKERQILARLEHPNIARLLDGGVTDEGLPFFVMEYVDGRRVTDYCVEERLSLNARIRLFASMCDAVHYANTKLVVHRDLKPSNILVTREGVPKLLDFGIAKLVEPDTSETTLSSKTETMGHFLTPDYAAPEQLQGEPVTTATDVYALGLVLYELLTERHPHEEYRSSGTPLARLRLTLDAVPVAPSRAATNAQFAIDRDLDAICLKALRPEPEERYSSVSAFQEDLNRFLDRHPVMARQGSRLYALRKLVQRHRVSAIASVLVSVSIVFGGIVSFIQAERAAVERDRAVDAESRVRAINDFLVHEMLEAARPEVARGEELTVKEVLDSASRQVGSSFSGDPELEADLRLALGNSYLSLAEFEPAHEHFIAAASLRQGSLGVNHPLTLEARSDMAEVQVAMGRIDDAEALLGSTFETQQHLLGEEALSTLISRGRLGFVSFKKGDYLEAERLLRDTVGELEARHPDEWRHAYQARRRLAETLDLQRKNAEAEALIQETLKLQEQRLGSDHPETLRTLRNLMDVMRRLLREHESAKIGEDALARHEKIFGRLHPETLAILHSVMGLYWYDDMARAEAMLADLHKRALATYGPEHNITLRARLNMATNASMQGKFANAEKYYGEVLALREKVSGQEHPTTLKEHRLYGQFLTKLDRVDEARSVYQNIVRVSDRVASREDADATFLNDYAWLLMRYVPPDMQDPEKALPLAERAVALTERKQIEFLHSVALAHHRLGDLDRALEIMDEIYRLPDSVYRYDMERDRIKWLGEKSPEAVEAFLLENLRRRQELRGDDDPLIGTTQRHLGLHFQRVGRLDESAEWLQASVAQFNKRFEPNHRRIARASSELGDVLRERGLYPEAEKLLLRAHETLANEADLTAVSQARMNKLYQEWER